jgi:multiple sugar transport system ATP-binding protein
MAEVNLNRVKKTFLGGKVMAINDVDLKVPDGTFATVLGPSGCGKTTLLRVVAGLERPDVGEVRIGKRIMNDVDPRDRNVAMVFQNYALYPHKRAFENIGMGLKLHGYDQSKIKERVKEVSKMLGIDDLLERYPKQLSGGQQQRVALARALVREPDVFLLDEPLSNLDAKVREVTRTELKRLFKQLRATVLYVTHDQTEAMMMSDLMVVMEGGLIQQIGDPVSVYRDPAHRFVAEFIGTYRINMIEGRIEQGKFMSADGSIIFSTFPPDTEKVWLGIRPEHITQDSLGDIHLTAETVLVEPTGPNSLVLVRVGRNELKMLSTSPLAPGQPVTLSFNLHDTFFFDARSGLRLKSDKIY